MGEFSGRKKRKVRARLIERDGLLCAGCGEPIDPTIDHNSRRNAAMALTIHHIRERQHGGRSTIDNLELRHRKCHPNNFIYEVD